MTFSKQALATALLATTLCSHPDLRAQDVTNSSTQRNGKSQPLTKWVGNFAGEGEEILVLRTDGFYLSGSEAAAPAWKFAGTTEGHAVTPETFFVGDFANDGTSTLATFDATQQSWFYGSFSDGQLVWRKAGDSNHFQAVEGGPMLFTSALSSSKASFSAETGAAASARPAAATQASGPTFPITASRKDNIPDTGLTMNTSISIDNLGRMSATTRTTEATLLRGATGGVGVLLVHNQTILWASKTVAFGVDGRWIGRWDRTDSWTDTVPQQFLKQANGVIIRQFDAPKNAGTIFGEWIAWLAAHIGEIIQVVIAIVGAIGG